MNAALKERSLRRADRSPRLVLRRGLLALGWSSLILAAFCFGVARSNDRFLAALNRDIAPENCTAEERVLRTFARVSEWRYFEADRIASPLLRGLARFEHASPLHVSARAALTAGADREGPCGSLSRSMLVLLHPHRIPARKAILYSAKTGIGMHTVVEIQLDGEWRVFDPTYRWYWRRPRDGQIATAADLAADPVLFASVIAHRPGFPIDVYTYDDVHHLRWEKLPGFPQLRRYLIARRGAEWVRSIQTPYLYERPMYLLAVFFLAGGAILLGLAAWLGAQTARRFATELPKPAASGAGTRSVAGL